MIRRTIYAALAIIVLIVTLSLYVAVRVRPELIAAQTALRSPADATEVEIEAARTGIGRAAGVLDGIPARILRLVPVARQNIDAVRATLDSAAPALEAAGELRRLIDDFEERNLISGGTIDIRALRKLEAPLGRAAETTGELERSLLRHRNGWLLPPVWERIDELLERTSDFRNSIVRMERVVPTLGPLLGSEGRRDYLVLLINNAELRGAGGIVSGLGSLSAHRGRLDLGGFSYYGDLSSRTDLRTVPAPPAFERRFARVGANSTIWINTTYSPDVPDVALVAGRLYRASTGRTVDGVIIADARGIASLLQPEAQVDLPRERDPVNAEEIPKYAYDGQYRDFEGPDPGRREALVDLGRSMFDTFLRQESLSLETLNRAGDALAGGHIRIMSFHPDEAKALIDADVAGDLAPTPSDSVLATVQNVGADKLDYWIDRKVEHLCDLRNRPARCVTRITLTNEAPRGLPDYVTQERRNTLAKDFLEIYVPEGAELSHVLVNDAPVEHFDEAMSGRTSVGIDVEFGRNETVVATVGYYLPFSGDEYSLVATPQPLAKDASIALSVRAPTGWIIEGPDGTSPNQMTYRGPFDRELRLHAHPDQRSGLTALWEALF